MNRPNMASVLHMLVGTIIDDFMAHRPLNTMLTRLVDRNGDLVKEVVPVLRNGRLHFEIEWLDRQVQGIHLRCHYHDVVGCGTLLYGMTTSDEWVAAFATSFETPAGLVCRVDFDRTSGWLNISWPELSDLLKRVAELSRA